MRVNNLVLLVCFVFVLTTSDIIGVSLLVQVKDDKSKDPAPSPPTDTKGLSSKSYLNSYMPPPKFPPTKMPPYPPPPPPKIDKIIKDEPK